MTGPYDSVIGVKKELVIERFLSGMPARFEAANGDVRLCAVLVECDDQTGRATTMERLLMK
jgi:2',3'-cyclic-nucleotide 2'-phosphodiesterase